MRSIKVLGALIVAILAIAASAAAASAHEFIFSKTGSLEGMAYNTQVFTTNAGTIECEGLSVSGEVVEPLTKEEQEASFTYNNCSASFGTVVELLLADYSFDANGWVDITAPILFDIESLLGSCSITVPPQSFLGAITYVNNFAETGHLGIEANVIGIEYEGNGGVCGTGLQLNGTYTGTSLVSLFGGGALGWL